jgi:hypothetical protein
LRLALAIGRPRRTLAIGDSRIQSADATFCSRS